jgi:predicted nucleic-acid-binding Zn-ribbon protein
MIKAIIDDHFGDLIGNSNTGKLHQPGCRAITMMNDSHKVETDGFGFENCGWCHGKDDIDQSYLDHFHEKKKIAAAKNVLPGRTSDDPEDIEICRDPYMNRIFKDSECPTCGSSNGIVKMYPAEHGVRLLGDPHKRWWVYNECSKCGYQTSLRKIKQRS